MYPDIDKKLTDVTDIARLALADEAYRNQLAGNLVMKNENVRYNSFRALKMVSEQQPDLLYPRWDFFVTLMRSSNSYHKMSAVLIIADLARADVDKRFENIFSEFYTLLNDRSMIVASYVAMASRVIVMHKPRLEKQVTRQLLDIDHTDHRDDRKDLIKAFIIETFESYFDRSSMKDEIVAFVGQQASSSSRKARKAASQFLKTFRQTSSSHQTE